MFRLLTICLAVATVAVTGCSGQSDEDREATGAKTEAAKQKPAVDSSAADERKLRAYVREGFGDPDIGADWYKDIKSLRIEGKTAIVSTDYFNDSDVTAFAQGMCVGVAGAARGPDAPLEGKIEVVAVLDQRSAPITTCGPRTPPS